MQLTERVGPKFLSRSGRLGRALSAPTRPSIVKELDAELRASHGLPLSSFDVLVSNAGGQFFAPAAEISDRGFQSVVDLNLTSVFRCTRLAHSLMSHSGGGAVINMSLSGVERGSMGLAHSIAARAGVLGMTRTLALEWAKNNIRVNCIGPGTVFTRGFGAEDGQEWAERFLEATPMQRDTAAEEVAELVAFLASPAATMISGQVLFIDGAAHLGPGLHTI